MPDDRDGHESGVTPGAEIPCEIREHAVEQFMGVRRLCLRLVGGLMKLFAGKVELGSSRAVV